MKKSLAVLLFSLAMSVSCSTQITPTSNNNLNAIKKEKINPNTIKGVVQFPKTGFKVKAQLDEIAKDTTVSIIYPHDYLDSNKANKIIATGLTDSTGGFEINPNFVPNNNDVFILEATKRTGGVGNSLMTIRTIIKKVNDGWQSMTTPAIYINSHTTALAIISGYNPTVISTSDTLSKIDMSGTIPNVTAINGVTTQTINDVSVLVDSVLHQEKDPFAMIKFSSNNYSIDQKANIQQLNQTNSCSGCSLIGVDLSKTDLADKDLSYTDLRGQNLSALDLSGTILIGADLRGSTLPQDLSYLNLSEANLTGQDLRNKDIKGTNFSNADLTSSNLSNLDMTKSRVSGVNFTSATMTNVNFEKVNLFETKFDNANIQGVNFEKADLRAVDLSTVINKDIPNVVIKGANLEGANLSDLKLNDKDLTNSKLQGGIFIKSNFQGKDFSNFDLSNTNFTEANLTNTIFDNNNLKGSQFIKSNLTNANIRNVNMSKMDFSESTFINTKLKSINFEGSNFTLANFNNTDIKRCSFKACDFSKAILNTEISGADSYMQKSIFKEANLSNFKPNNVNFNNSDFSGAIPPINPDDFKSSSLQNVKWFHGESCRNEDSKMEISVAAYRTEPVSLYYVLDSATLVWTVPTLPPAPNGYPELRKVYSTSSCLKSFDIAYTCGAFEGTRYGFNNEIIKYKSSGSKGIVSRIVTEYITDSYGTHPLRNVYFFSPVPCI